MADDKATGNGRGGPAPALSNIPGCPLVRRADTQVGPYTAILVGAVAAARQPGKISRVGYVSGSGSLANRGPYFEALRQGLEKLGYTEGKNISYEYRGVEGQPAKRLVQEPMICGLRSGQASGAMKLRHAGGIVIWIPFFNGMTDVVRHLDSRVRGNDDKPNADFK